MLVPLVASLALAMGAGPAAPEPAGKEALLRKIVDAYGGAEALARARAFREEGAVTSLLHPGTRGRIERSYARSGRLRVVTRFPGAPDEVRVIDGGRGWRNGEPSGGPPLVAMVLQAARLDLPVLLDAWRQRVMDRGEVQGDGHPLRVLALEVGPGLTVEAHVDPADGRILRTRTTGVTVPGGPTLEFATVYSDFRTVGGVLFAFHEANWANGQTTGDTVLEKVEVLPALPEATFRP
jgi:hypothetical protein